MTDDRWTTKGSSTRTIVIASIATVGTLLLLICSGVAWLFLQKFDDSPNNSSEAISAYYRSLQKQNVDGLASVTCSGSKDNAKSLIDDFNAGFKRDGVTLTDIRWSNEGQRTSGNDSTIVRVRATYEVEKSGEIFVRNEEIEFAVVNNKVCSATPK
ncbi:hypothetical protein [Cryptosporangium phraense]|uniref:DUF4878 domain-containing protein n=1 Tax=Cryptosporangium phraense TaxID=2593070 RepID=A0A545AK39_9ACTN|nr:hypothetical protein [Cryptosporangium phraense]TQS41659.1 hypothetical protein FL583_28810 [Cryptosporangium phraense]